MKLTPLALLAFAPLATSQGRALDGARPDAVSPTGSTTQATVVSLAKISNATPGFPDLLDFGDWFGGSVVSLGDLDGDGSEDFAAGAWGTNETGDNDGAVWIVFQNPDGTLKDHRRISPPGGPDRTFFGKDMACVGDMDGDGVVDLAVGAPQDDEGNSGAGAVFILFLETDGGVKSTAKILHTDPFDGFSEEGLAYLGDVDGDGTGDLAVNVDRFETNGGRIWIVFLNADGTEKGRQAIGLGEGGFVGALPGRMCFGCGLAGLGDLDGDGVPDLAVGTPHPNFSGSPGPLPGAFWVLFLNTDGTVKAQQEVTAGTGGFTGAIDPGDRFGGALGSLGDRDGDGTLELAVGANRDDDGAEDNGAVWILSLTTDGTVTGHEKISGIDVAGPVTQTTDFGGSVGRAGDVDGDGETDLLVGGRIANTVFTLLLDEDGALLGKRVMDDSDDGLANTLDSNSHFGQGVTAIGDLNGDGTGDVVVATEGLRGMFVLFLAPDGSVASYRGLEPPVGETAFRQAAATLGDLDGDGVLDLVVGALGDSENGPSRGAVWVLLMNPDGSYHTAQKINETNGGFQGTLDDHDLFGYSVTRLGDLDGDGVTEVAVGALLADPAGETWILFLNADGTVKDEVRIAEGLSGFTDTLELGDQFGRGLAGLGDVDGDGVRDMTVGAPLHGPSGAVWVLFLNTDGTVKAQQRIDGSSGGFTGPLATSDFFGDSVGRMRDLDCDGVPELVVGAVLDDAGADRAGAAWILFLRPDGTVKDELRIDATGALAGLLDELDLFGDAVAPIGDVNGDGIEDLAISASRDDDGGDDHGALYLVALDGLAVVDFETEDDLVTPLVSGQALDGPPVFGDVFQVESVGSNIGLAAFDSTPGAPSADPDLAIGSGNLLVFQNPFSGVQTVPGVYDLPDDSSGGGTVFFTRDEPVEFLSVDLVDVDVEPQNVVSVMLFDTAGRMRIYDVPAGWTGDRTVDATSGWRTLDLTTLAPQPGFAATATGIESGDFDAEAVVELRIDLGSSGAIDDVCFDPRPAAPTEGPRRPSGRTRVHPGSR